MNDETEPLVKKQTDGSVRYTVSDDEDRLPKTHSEGRDESVKLRYRWDFKTCLFHIDCDTMS